MNVISLFVNHVKNLGVVSNKRIIERLHIEINEAKALRTFIRNYTLSKSERLSTNFKVTLHKAMIRSVMTYAGAAYEIAETPTS
jgi:hypothetical protein